MTSTPFLYSSSTSSLLTTTWVTVLLVSWWWRRCSLVEWSWSLLVDRWGNPAMLVDTLTPNMAGDMAHFLNYRHFLLDLKASLISRNPHLIGMKMLFFLVTEMLAFARMIASLILARNVLLLLLITFTMLQGEDLNLDMAEVSLVTILAMGDMFKAAYVVFKPEVLIPDTIEAHLVMHGPFLLQIALVTWFTETQI